MSPPMVDPKTLNYYVLLAMGVGSLLLGIYAVYIALFELTSIDSGLQPRVLGGPVLIIIGVYLIYFTQKHGRDVVEADLSRNR